MSVDYLKKILTAKVYDVAIESPLDIAPTLSMRLGNTVLLKREDQQPVFSFKLRGAYNRMAHLSAGERARGVVAASAGNQRPDSRNRLQRRTLPEAPTCRSRLLIYGTQMWRF